MQLSCRTYCILLALGIVLGGRAASIEALCGEWYELRATPMEGWHFDHWSDGDTSAVRQVEVLGDATYIAYFAANCGDYGNLPVVSLYDWLLMLDVRTINMQGYYFEPEHVDWYCVRGEIDSIDSDKPRDDQWMCSGYYLTLDSSLVGTGDYYAVVDVSHSPSGALCKGLMRSLIIHYASTGKSGIQPRLTPTMAHRGEMLTLSGLKGDEPVLVTLYDTNGHLLSEQTVCSTRHMMQAPAVAGCYCVVVTTKDERCVIRFIVNGR